MEPVTVGLIAVGVWLFAPPAKDVIGRDAAKDQQAAVVAKVDAVEDGRAALDYWIVACRDAVARADKLQGQIDAAKKTEDAGRDAVIRNAQENNQMVLDILRSIPAGERTPKTILATLLAAKTDAGLAGLLGELSPERQLELATLWQALLAEDEKIKADAQAKVDAMDKEREAALRAKARAEGAIEGLQESLSAQKAAVAEAQKREVAASESLKEKTAELRAEIGSQARRAAGDIWFWRLWLFGLVGVIFFCGRVMPQAAKFWPWMAPFNRFTAFLFRVISGQEIK